MKHGKPITRRAWVAGCAGLAFGGVRAQEQEAPASAGHRISTAQLQQALELRFPRRFTVSGLVDVEVRVPRLRLLPEQNRLGAELLADISGAALRRRHAGSVDLDFALRYESSDQSVRAHRIRMNSIRLEGLNPDTADMFEEYVGRLSHQAVREVALHRLRPQDLALAHTMGLEPGTITVTQQGLWIALVPQK